MNNEDAVSAAETADLVRVLYQAFLDRHPSDDEVAVHLDRIAREGPLAAISVIAYSGEAEAIRARASAPPPPFLPGGTLSIGLDDVTRVIAGVLTATRGEAPAPYDVELRVDAFERGAELSTVLDDALRAPPPPRHAPEDDASIARTTQILFRLALGRLPRPADLEIWRAAVSNGGRLSDVVFGIGDSREAQDRRAGLDLVPGLKVQLAFEIMLGRGASAAEVDSFRAAIEDSDLDVAPLVMQLFAEEANRRLDPAVHRHASDQAYIFGSRGGVSVATWQASAGAVAAPGSVQTVLAADSAIRPAAVDPAGVPVVSIVTSLYRGGAFIRSFLENITAQTIFRTQCELIIIDAASPEGEAAVIEEFRRDFPNIVYHRAATRVGIYEAWNMGVGLARGRYITNANLDDLRRVDSLEVQAAVLDTFDFVDVTYQDVLYTFTAGLSFDEIAQRDLRTDLPIVSRYNLMEFNSPHNAPMWRAALHRDVGLFDEGLQSAGDFEFWLRCRAADKTFYKVNEAHAAYYVNPEGISTRPDTRGVAEAHAVSARAFRTLVSPLLLIANDAFLTRLDEVERAPLRTGRRYDIVQSALLALGLRREGVSA